MEKARCGRRCTGLLILTDNWEEECCQSDVRALGGGVRCLPTYKYPIDLVRYSEITATQQCK
jgi:hypothetical protein